MPIRLRDILTTRSVADTERNRLALLRYVVLLLVVPGSATALFQVITWLTTGDQQALGFALWSLIAHPPMLACYWLARRERYQTALYVPSTFMWLAASAMLWFLGPSIYLVLLFQGAIVIAGLLLGTIRAVLTAILSIATFATLGWLSNAQNGAPVTTSTLLAQSTTLAIGGTLMLVILAVIDRRTSHRLEQEKLSLEQQVAQQHAAYRASEQRMRAIFEGMPVPTFTWRRDEDDFTLVDYNEAALAQTRGGVAHFMGVLASQHYADRPDILADLNNCYARQTQFQREMHYEFVRSQGSCELRTTYAYVAPDTVLVHTEDVSETKRAQRSRQESERRLRNLLSSIPGMSYRCHNDEHWTMTFVSEGCHDLTGYSPEDLLQNRRISFAELLHPDDLVRIQNSPGSQSAREGGYTVTYRIQTAQGETKWVWDQGQYVKDDDGNEIAQEGLILDISETHRAQAELRASEARNRQLVEAFPDGIIVTETTRDIPVIMANRAALAMCGVDSETDLLGRSFYDLLAVEDRPRARYNAAHGVGVAPMQHVEYTMLKASGESFPIEVSATQVGDFATHGQVFIIYARDISSRRHLQEQLQTALKLEAVGRLAGGIAHDFNNLLTVINGYASFLTESLEDTDDRQGDALAVLQAGQRAAHLTKQLLAFSRRQVMQTEVMNINDVITDIEPMLSSLIGEKIAYTSDLEQGLPGVRIDRAQIERAITNLVTNARDAMPDGGTLHISSRYVSLPKPIEAIPEDVPAGDYVTLAVIDDGIGMAPSVKSNALEPFYTTKEVGQGTGLGLSMVYGTIRQLQGAIQIESEPSKGTTILLYLPISPDPAKPSSVDASISRIKGTEQILLVEDEPIVREYVARALEQLGYQVVAAEDGAQAMAIAQHDTSTFDLLLSDVVMPGKNGPELARELDRVCHIPHKLFMSGHSQEIMEQMGSMVADGDMIRKPFSPYDLARRIRRLFDGTAAP